MDNGELWYAWKPLCRQPISGDWLVEFGFLNTNDEPIYHGDILRVPWLEMTVTVVYYAATKTCQPMFLYDYREPKRALNRKHRTTCHARPAFLDSRIENLGSWREPRTRYETPEKPEPVKRLDIYGHIANRSKS